MKNRELKDKIQKLSLGVFDTLVDSTLFLFALWAQSYRVGSGKRDIFEAIENAINFAKVVRKIYLKRGTYQAEKKGFLTKDKDVWKITELGKKRLRQILPRYRTERPWEGKIYLITYDIPEKRKRDRDLLREYLKRISCGMLQASVWLTPYNPKKLLSDFVVEGRLSGLVIVSDIGRDGHIGQMPIGNLVRKIYKLDQLNGRYRDFLQEVERGKLDHYAISSFYFSILRDDPQLPFPLLPKDWLGDKAYRVFQETGALRIL